MDNLKLNFKNFVKYLRGAGIMFIMFAGMFALIFLIKFLQTGEFHWEYLTSLIYVIIGYVSFGIVFYLVFFWIKNFWIKAIVTMITCIVPLTLLL